MTLACARTGPNQFRASLVQYAIAAARDVQQPAHSVHILHFAAAELTGPAAPRVSRVACRALFAGMDLRLQSDITKEPKKMLWTICVILLVLWALGMATSYTAGGLLHLLLLVALIVMIFRLVQGRRVV